MPKDKFASFPNTADGPPTTLVSITPDDNTDLGLVTTALNVATPGTVRVTMADGSTGDISIDPGHSFPLRATRVWATGTTATGIRGLA